MGTPYEVNAELTGQIVDIYREAVPIGQEKNELVGHVKAVAKSFEDRLAAISSDGIVAITEDGVGTYTSVDESLERISEDKSRLDALADRFNELVMGKAVRVHPVSRDVKVLRTTGAYHSTGHRAELTLTRRPHGSFGIANPDALGNNVLNVVPNWFTYVRLQRGFYQIPVISEDGEPLIELATRDLGWREGRSFGNTANNYRPSPGFMPRTNNFEYPQDSLS